MRRVVGERTQRERRDSDEVIGARVEGCRRCHTRHGPTPETVRVSRVCGVRSGTDNRSKRETKPEKKVESENMIGPTVTSCHSLARTVTRCGPSSLPSASSVAALAARKASSPFSRLKGVSSGSPASCSVTLEA